MKSTTPLPFQRLGHYRIDARIGSGGMGDVYKGYDELLDRIVAVKVLPDRLASQEAFVRRFRAEATAAARVNHPNVVPIHFVGEDGGRQFFVMRYVEGETLAQRVARLGRLPLDEAVQIVEQCLAGLGAAHAQGLIHRDVKPGNILIDGKTGRAVLVDFGLARLTENSPQTSASGPIMGTIDYIAPEQARQRRLDERADLYSLGTVFYQLLSGRLPFEAETPMAMLFLHAYEPAAPLLSVAPQVPAPLGDIVGRMMAKSPEDRYQSCEEVLADLGAFRRGTQPAAAVSERGVAVEQPVSPPPTPSAVPEPAADEDFLEEVTGQMRTSPWARLRNWALLRLDRHAPDLVRQLQSTTQQVDGAVAEYTRRRNRLARLCEQARRIAADLSEQIRVNLEAAAEARQSADRNADEKAPQCEENVAALRRQRGQQQRQIEDLQFKLNQAEATLARLCSQRDVLRARLQAAGHRVKPGRRLWQILRPLVAPLVLVAVLIASAPRLWQSHRPGPGPGIGPGPRPGKGLSKASSPDRRPAALRRTPADELLRKRSLGPPFAGVNKQGGPPPAPSEYLARTLAGHTDCVESVAFSPDGSLLASGSRDGTARLWDRATGKLLRTLQAHTDPVFAVAFSPDGALLASMGKVQEGDDIRHREKTIILWDVSSGQILHTLKTPQQQLARERKSRIVGGARPRNYHGESFSIAFSPDGSLLASSGECHAARLWDVPAGKLQKTFGGLAASTDRPELEGLRDEVISVAFSPDGSTLATVGWSTHLRFWDMQTGTSEERASRHRESIWSVTFSPDGQWFASASGDRSIALWDLATKRIWRTLRKHEDRVRSVAFSPDGKLLASASDDQTVMLWDAANGRFCSSLSGHAGPVRSVAFAPDGSTLATAGWDNTVKLWDRPEQQTSPSHPELTVLTPSAGSASAARTDTSGGELVRFEGHGGEVLDLRFTPDGKRVISSAADCTVRLWDLAGGREIRRFTGYAGAVEGLDVSPDGTLFVSGDGAGDLVLRDIETGNEVRRFAAHLGPVRCVRFSDDGKRLVSGGQDCCVRVWDVASGREARNFLCKAPINAVSFRANSRSVLATVSSEKAVHKWSVLGGDGEPECTFQGHSETVRACIYFPASPWPHAISSCGEDGPEGKDFIIRMWATLPGQEELRQFVGHTGRPWGLALSPDLTRLVSGAADRTVRLWDVNSGREIHRFEGHEGPVRPVDCSPDGRLLASGSADTTVRVWKIPDAAGLLAGSHASGQGRLPPDAVALLTFERSTIAQRAGTTLVQDVGAAGNHFSGPGEPSIHNGRVGTCLDLKDRLLRLPRPLLHKRTEYTLSAWVYRRKTSGSFNLYCEGGPAGSGSEEAAALQIGLSSQACLEVRVANAAGEEPWSRAATPAGSAPAGRWLFLAIRLQDGSHSGGKLTVRINDQSFDLSSHSASGGHAGEVRLGPGEGMIDEMAIYSRALSDTEIQTLYEMGVNQLGLSQ